MTTNNRRPRAFYAIRYAYGREGVNNGQRPDLVFRFDTIAERTRWLAEQARAGIDAESVSAKDSRTRKALRAADLGLDWPQAV